MTNHVTIDESIEGEQVFNAKGDKIGIVSGIRSGTVYVDADPSITDRIMSKLGWDEIDEDDYPLPKDSIDRITDGGIHLKSTF